MAPVAATINTGGPVKKKTMHITCKHRPSASSDDVDAIEFVVTLQGAASEGRPRRRRERAAMQRDSYVSAMDAAAEALGAAVDWTNDALTAFLVEHAIEADKEALPDASLPTCLLFFNAHGLQLDTPRYLASLPLPKRSKLLVQDVASVCTDGVYHVVTLEHNYMTLHGPVHMQCLTCVVAKDGVQTYYRPPEAGLPAVWLPLDHAREP
ncbi:hypothetical protein SPRG_13458 [Saprolegnia parasitica CBS 223.65]|uniref:Uncharacterized protein n=1 Tax=Saprolegnia parasitica (strain CBS 223.65) TaxID=695850 RepID=A0A067BP22_SAPPC|nr:hypothetical protein SPRG_13458 [Saprolegnia parasitica CBS 223.65]KDO20204.1 hypothetical protein SPRG_13458 [Saprolegnia parasitica CBS 223.65]|eukprot:XP_012209091.1 hypothetical protein SPRG_13458 [Saprolegnia parasitica CBS 223.65]